MALPYSNATSGRRALDEIQGILAGFGCSCFGTMTDTANGEVLVQFEYRDRKVSVRASIRGYAAAWLKENPWSTRRSRPKVEYEREAMRKGEIAVYSALRDWIKGQVTAVETGILTFEGAFLGQIMLPTGKTILEEAMVKKLLPAPTNEGGSAPASRKQVSA